MDTLAPSLSGRWTVELTRHAIARFREWFCPALDLVGAEERLLTVLDHARLQPEPPPWVVPNSRKTAGYLVLGDDLALPLMDIHRDRTLVAVTCIPRGGITSGMRARRNQRRRRP